MKIYAKDTVSFPVHALCYLVNDDRDSITEDDLALLDEALKPYIHEAEKVNGYLYFEQKIDPDTNDVSEAYFAWHPFFGLACDCVDLHILTLVTSKEK